MDRVKRRYANMAAGVIASVMFASSSYAMVIWDETVNGDLSNNRLAPTALVLANGSNTLSATSTGATDREYVRLDVPSGHELTAIILNAYSGGDGTSFIGVQAGTTFTEPPSGTNVANLLGYAHFGPDAPSTVPVGTDALPDMGTGAGAQGFTPPLAAGSYTYWIQQAAPIANSYTWDFQVTEVPGILGDTDGDDDVDFDDFLAVQNFFGDGGPASPGDADNDGDCDFDDFIAVQNFFGTGVPPGVAFVPEPGSVVLAGVCVMLGLARRGGTA